jgi:hypothetical protein
MRLPHLVIAVICSALLACSGEKPRQIACSGGGENLLQDAAFATLAAPRYQRKWHASEHAAGQTFAYSASGGSLKIRKTGGEPWFILTQSLDPQALAGQRVMFGAELKLDLTLPSDHAFTPGGGLTFLAKRGNRVVVNSSLEHEPRLGQTDWTPVSIVVSVPPGSDSVRVGILHQAEGILQVRKPFLKLAAKTDCEN